MSENEENLPPLFTVLQLTSGVQNLLGTVFADVRVAGEITNLTVASRGHGYFTLKDAEAQLSAVIWNTTRKQMETELRDGLEVVCRGRIDVYPPRGTYQLIVSSVEEKGLGSLEAAFLKLKQRLAAEGLFAPEHKKPLPKQIRKVGVVTSPDGAAIHDFLQVLHRRFRGVDVVIYPSAVQGRGAAAQLAQGIRFLNTNAGRLGIDCIVVTRGGGSMEDLWEFNEEILVRAIYESELPVLSGVGHEIDVTLCDLAADRRALTPSEAAEMVSPDVSDLVNRLKQDEKRLQYALQTKLERLETRLDSLKKHPSFRFPYRRWEQAVQAVDLLETSLARAARVPLERFENSLARMAGQLQTLSPLNVLARGYSLTQKESGEVVRCSDELVSGEKIVTRFSEGSVVSRVE